jgi:hypoxanthine-guanine phosphoribosyltransferase
MNKIETARSPKEAITIISEEECRAGLKKLQKAFSEMFPDHQQVSVIPILRSGFRLGKELTDNLGIRMNPMRMSYYKEDTSRLPVPECLTPPDITRILSLDGSTKRVVFTECVVDSQETVLAAMEEINRMIDAVGELTNKRLAYPEYYTFAYVSKIGERPLLIPNMVAAFSVNPDIWVGGLGCDLPGDRARNLSHLVGILSPFAETAPKPPYFVPLLN